MSARKDALRVKLVDSAARHMAANGLTGLRARGITKDAGCALGSLYTVFGDLDELILHVNARTLDRLGEALGKAAEGASPEQALLRIALEYARFARENRPLWDALYDHKMPEGTETPEWFRTHQRAVMRHVVDPLAGHDPDLPEDLLHLHARTYFSAVHGIVSISLQGRFVGLPGDRLEAEITRFVALILAAPRDTVT